MCPDYLDRSLEELTFSLRELARAQDNASGFICVNCLRVDGEATYAKHDE